MFDELKAFFREGGGSSGNAATEGGPDTNYSGVPQTPERGVSEQEVDRYLDFNVLCYRAEDPEKYLAAIARAVAFYDGHADPVALENSFPKWTNGDFEELFRRLEGEDSGVVERARLTDEQYRRAA